MFTNQEDIHLDNFLDKVKDVNQIHGYYLIDDNLDNNGVYLIQKD